MVEIWFYAQSMQLVPHTCAGTFSFIYYYLLPTICFVIPTIDSLVSTLTYYLFTSLYAVVKELEALQGNLSGKSSNGSRVPILGLEHFWLIKNTWCSGGPDWTRTSDPALIKRML